MLIDEKRQFQWFQTSPNTNKLTKQYTSKPCLLFDRESSWGTSVAGFIIVGGDYGNRHANRITLFNVESKTFQCIHRLSTNISRLGVIVHNQCIFLIGGRYYNGGRWLNVQRVQCMDITNPSELISRRALYKAVTHPIVVTDESRIYVIGGRDSYGKLTSFFQIYHVGKDRHTMGPSLGENVDSQSCGAVNTTEQIIVFTPNFRHIYTKRTNKWEKPQQHNLPAHSITVLSIASDIYLYFKKLSSSQKNCSIVRCNVTNGHYDYQYVNQFHMDNRSMTRLAFSLP